MSGFQVLSFNDVESTVQAYKRRKVHNKTRTGCLACRAKRVKCDEARPICVRCKRNKRPCLYDAPPQSQQIVAVTHPSPIFSLPHTEDGIPTKLIQHLQRHQYDILCMSVSQMMTDMFHSSSLVRHTILALSSSHLRYKTAGCTDHRLTELHQQNVALAHYQKALGTSPDVLGQDGINHLLMCALLLNMMAFMLPHAESPSSNDPYASWVFSADQNRLGWLALQAGLRPLMLSMPNYVVKAMDFLAPLFKGGVRERFVFPLKHGIEVLPETWKKAFDYREPQPGGCESVSPEDVYRAPLIVLASIKDLEPVGNNVYHNVSFLVKLYPHFRSLLYQREFKAMWIFGYWLGIMSRYSGAWWSEQRVRRDYEAMKMWMKMTRVAEKDEIWKELVEELESLYVPTDVETRAAPSATKLSAFEQISWYPEKSRTGECMFAMLGDHN